MPEKQKAKNWKGIQTVIAAMAMLMLIALCNIIASFDHQPTGNVMDNLTAIIFTPTPSVIRLPEGTKFAGQSPQVVTQTRSS